MKTKNILSNIQNISKIKYINENRTGFKYLNPLLIYSIIKFQPQYFVSDIKFISTFIDLDSKNKCDNLELIEELQLSIKYILDISNKNLNGNISSKEFNNLCQQSTNK